MRLLARARRPVDELRISAVWLLADAGCDEFGHAHQK
jgi:hypothetical protein